MAVVAKQQKRKQTVWKVLLWSIDHVMLENLVKKLMDVANSHAIKGSVVSLPTKAKRYAILRSPFIYKQSMEHYKWSVRKKVVFFTPPQDVTLDIFSGIMVSPGIQMEVKIESK